jgi:hypothetical protein
MDVLACASLGGHCRPDNTGTAVVVLLKSYDFVQANPFGVSLGPFRLGLGAFGCCCFIHLRLRESLLGALRSSCVSRLLRRTNDRIDIRDFLYLCPQLLDAIGSRIRLRALEKRARSHHRYCMR